MGIFYNVISPHVLVHSIDEYFRDRIRLGQR
jgi:hypothetical protein